MATRGSWVFREGRMVPKHEALAKDYAVISSKRSSLAAPAVISDNMTPFKSHVDGKTWFDSKRAWEKHVKANGCSIVGNDMPSAAPRFDDVKHRRDVEADVAQAVQMVEQGYKPPPVEHAEEFKTDEVVKLARENQGVAYVSAEPVNLKASEPDIAFPPEPKKPRRGYSRQDRSKKRGK